MESTTGEDEWELCNDDGFVYKRKKRRVDDLQPPPSAPPLPDPEAEEKTRRERKRKALLNLKARYQKEIDHWEHFSNALRAMQEKTQHRTNFDFEEMGSSLVSASKLADDNRLGGSESALDELLVQLEAQEEIIQDVTNLCDVADAICNAHEEWVTNSLVDLPVWSSSPRELMAALCDE